MGFRIGVDTGGTHTDLVLIEEGTGRVVTHKLPTTPQDLSVGILAGLRHVLAAAGGGEGEVARFVYGTTLVTNLIVQQSDVPVGLITTAGFRDVLEIGRASRKANIYDIHWRPPPPLVPRHLRLTVAERIAHDGEVVTALDEASVREALRALAAARVGSIAVCLLNAYANPAHERRIAAIAAQECPEIDISLSSDVVREFREYERMSTTALNAFVRRSLSRHLDGLAAALAGAGVPGAPYIMRGNGGIMSFAAAKSLPAAITHSGPMGGIVGGMRIAEACGIGDLITLDMGGTSADVSLISGGKPILTTRGKLGHYPVLLPMLDLVTIGAGGGSLGWVDAGGAMRVGPRSAGAVPGPACYAQGGEDPTLTDCNLLAGRLNAEFFLAGARRLDATLSERALRTKLCDRLGLTPAEAAIGMMAIAESHMVDAIKLISVQRGLDPRDFTLVAFGGAGPLHGVRLAEELAVDRVLIPPAPGNVSAMGLLGADIRHDLVRTRVRELGRIDPEEVSAALAEMLAEGSAMLARDIDGERRERFLASLDLRYQGQNYELSLPLPAAALDAAEVARLAARFHAEHKRVYGYDLPSRAIQLVNLRLACIATLPSLFWPRRPRAAASAEPASRRRVQIDARQAAELPVYRFTTLAPEHRFDGPAIVEHPGSTLFVAPGWSVRYDEFANAHLQRGRRR